MDVARIANRDSLLYLTFDRFAGRWTVAGPRRIAVTGEIAEFEIRDR